MAENGYKHRLAAMMSTGIINRGEKGSIISTYLSCLTILGNLWSLFLVRESSKI